MALYLLRISIKITLGSGFQMVTSMIGLITAIVSLRAALAQRRER